MKKRITAVISTIALLVVTASPIAAVEGTGKVHASASEKQDSVFCDTGLSGGYRLTSKIHKAENLAEAKTVNLNVDGSIAGIADPVQPASWNDEWKGSFLFYGKFGGTPVKYRVLDADTTDFNTEHTMFLDCDSVLDPKMFSNGTTNTSQTAVNTWKYSDAYLYLNSLKSDGVSGSYVYDADDGFLSQAFSGAEQNVIVESSNTNHKDWKASNSILKTESYTTSDLTGEKIFILSIEEAMHSEYGYSNSNDKGKSRGKKNKNEACGWWLRSARSTDEVMIISNNNMYGHTKINTSNLEGSSPAFNLKLSSILFATEVNKSAASNSNFAATADGTTNEWAVTLFDGNTSFNAELDGVSSVNAGGTINLKNISGATATAGVESNRISAMLVNNNNTVVAYGKIAEKDAGTASVVLPGSVGAGNYTLKVFSEQANASDCTNYASKSVDIPLTVIGSPSITTPSPSPSTETPSKTPDVVTPPPIETATAVPTQTPVAPSTETPSPVVTPDVSETPVPTATPDTPATEAPTNVPATKIPTATPDTPATVSPSKTPDVTETPAATKTPSPKPDESGQSGNRIEKRKDLSTIFAVVKLHKNGGVKLTWNKKSGCSGYEVYWSFCDGKQNFKKVKTVKSTGKRVFIHNKNLNKKRAYKYYVAAYKIKDGRKYYLSKSPVVHVAMKLEKHTNVKSIKLNKTKVTLKAKKTFKIKAVATADDSKKKLLSHDRKFRYCTSNKAVATVTKKGVVKAKKKGNCIVYVVANNGVAKQLKVTVK